MNPRNLLAPLLALFILCSGARAETSLVSYAHGDGIVIRDDAGQLFRLGVVLWGPKWGYTGMKANREADGNDSRAVITGKLGGSGVPYALDTVYSLAQPNQFRLSYTFSTEADSDLTLVIVSISADQRFNSGKLEIIDNGQPKPLKLPLGRGDVGQAVSALKFTDAAGRVTTFTLTPAARIAMDGDARVVLAKDKIAGKTPVKQEIVVDLPAPTQWFPTAAHLPDPDNWAAWFPWNGSGALPEDSVLNMSSWFDAPAGKHGRVVSKDDKLLYNGKPMAFWGLNVCYASTAPTKELADKRAALYASHGINAVRLHKYADGPGWAGILTKNSFTEFDPAGLDRMDYFVSKLKEKGIFIKLSPTFGTFGLLPGDKDKVPFWSEMFGNKPNGGTPHGAAYLSTELRDLQITQMLNLLKHKNPYTGLTYAEDPAVMVVELLNEQSILFFGTGQVLQKVPTLRKRTAERFTDWLLQRYGSKEAVLARWDKGGLNTFAGEGFKNESFEDKSIVPYGNPWYYDPAQLDGQLKSKKARLLDTIAFLYELQNEFYAHYIKALREAGYTGEIVASNWQAGRAFSHYSNLHSDALAGIVDRHNYFKGATPMIDRPGGGSLSAGMQQVSNRPFMLSEWIHEYPTRYQFEGSAIIGAYGMGLQGWDVSYIFQNKDPGGYEGRLGTDKWVVAQPEVLGLFPAVARQVLRNDVKESPVVVARSVHVPSLHEGRLGFDDKVEQGYDDKSFDSKTVPAAAMAAVRSVVSFDSEYKDTTAFDFKPYLKDGSIVSSTGQLRWTGTKDGKGGWFTMDTPGTKAVVGFAPGKPETLGEATIDLQSSVAAVYLAASEKEATVATSKRLLLVTIARSLNDGMKYIGATKLLDGKGPIRMEPVKARITLNRPGTPTIHVLDHNGKRTGQTLPVENGAFTVDGATTKTCYYEIAY